MNKVYALIGPAGSGKSLLAKELGRRGIPALVSHTTRPPKPGERDGEDYYFVTGDQFAKAQPFEKVSNAGYLFGLTKEEVMNKMSRNSACIVDIDMAGITQLKRMIGDSLESIFILVDKETIYSRFMMQGDKLEEVKARIDAAEAKGEYDSWRVADHVVKNTGSVESSVLQILAIMGKVTPIV